MCSLLPWNTEFPVYIYHFFPSAWSFYTFLRFRCHKWWFFYNLFSKRIRYLAKKTPKNQNWLYKLKLTGIIIVSRITKKYSFCKFQTLVPAAVKFPWDYPSPLKARVLKFWFPDSFGPTWCIILRILNFGIHRVSLTQIPTKKDKTLVLWSKFCLNQIWWHFW
jgi:hypothetical protein